MIATRQPQDTSSVQRRFHQVYLFTLKSALVNAGLLVLKLVAGCIGGSYALIADALHSAADFLQDVMAVLYLRMGRLGKNDRHDYGYGRYVTVATLFVAVLLFVAGTYIVAKTILMIIAFCSLQPESLSRPEWMALVAVLVCVALKGVLFLVAQSKAKALDSRFISVNAHRYRLDVISSAGTAIAIVCATLLSAKWRVIDPIAALIIALFILRMAAATFRFALNELLDKSLPQQTEKEIADIARKVEQVDDVIRVLTRRVGGKVAIELVVNINGALTLNQVHRRVVQIEDQIIHHFGEVAHMAVYVEPTPDVQNVVG